MSTKQLKRLQIPATWKEHHVITQSCEDFASIKKVAGDLVSYNIVAVDYERRCALTYFGRLSLLATMKTGHAFQAFVIVSMVTACFGQDPCVEYDLMWMENGRRSSDFNSMDTSISICDAYLNQTTWYRFNHDAGSRLIERPVEPWYCGTQAPIWLNGTHPTDEVEVTAEVCASYSSSNTCGWSGTVRIRLCNESGSEFFVYLLAVPPGCPLAYCVDAASRKQCTPPLAWLPEDFRCESEEIKTTLTIPPPVTPTCYAKTPNPGWSTWGPWSSCSKSCDYGMQSRKRQCGRLPCGGPASKNQSCNQFNCPELPEQRDRGILLQLKSTDYGHDMMSKFVVKQQKINTIIRHSINKICSQSATLCCGHTIESVSSVSIEYVTPDDIYAAQGFPRPMSDLVGYYKIIAVINEEVSKAICGGSDSRQRRTLKQVQPVTPHFVPFIVMEMAIRESLFLLEQEAGFYVKEFIDPATLTEGNHEDVGSCPTATCIVPIVICIIVIPATAAMITCFCYAMKALKTKLDTGQGPPAYEYIESSSQCSSPSPSPSVTIVPFTIAAFAECRQDELPAKLV